MTEHEEVMELRQKLEDVTHERDELKQALVNLTLERDELRQKLEEFEHTYGVTEAIEDWFERGFY